MEKKKYNQLEVAGEIKNVQTTQNGGMNLDVLANGVYSKVYIAPHDPNSKFNNEDKIKAFNNVKNNLSEGQYVKITGIASIQDYESNKNISLIANKFEAVDNQQSPTIEITGRLTNDSVVRNGPKSEFQTFSIAHNQLINNEKKVSFLNVINPATKENYIKGDAVNITGTIKPSKYEKDGKMIYTFNVEVKAIERSLKIEKEGQKEPIVKEQGKEKSTNKSSNISM